MPVILPPDGLGRVARPRAATTSTCSAAPGAGARVGCITIHPVSTEVNNVRNEGAAPRLDAGRRPKPVDPDAPLDEAPALARTTGLGRRRRRQRSRCGGRRASTASGPTGSLPWLVAVVLFLVLAALALAQARSLDGRRRTWRIYTQARLAHRPRATSPSLTIERRPAPARPAGVVPLLPGRLADPAACPPSRTLLVVQSAALALGVVPLWRIARRVANLRVGAAATLLVAYALYPAVQNLNLADFHPETLALPALLGRRATSGSRHWRSRSPCAACWSSLCRADLGLVVAGLRPAPRRAGRAARRRHHRGRRPGLDAASPCSSVQPAFGDGGYAHIDAFIDVRRHARSTCWSA